MNKTQIFDATMQLCIEHKANKKLIKALTELLKSKSGGGIALNPMQTIDGVNYHHCRYTDIYVIESEIVMSNDKSKGYSKKAIAHWTKLGKDIAKINAEAMQLLLSGDSEAGKRLAADAEKLKLDRNTPALYTEIKQYFIDNNLSIK